MRKKAEKNAGGSFSSNAFSDIQNIKCLNEKIAVYSAPNGKKGIMLLDGTVTEEADEDDIFVVSDAWRSKKIVAQGPRSEYMLLVNEEDGKILRKQYHGTKVPEEIVYWDMEEGNGQAVYADADKEIHHLSAADVMLDDGLYPIKNSPDGNGVYGYVDENLNLMLTFTYQNACDFSEGLAAVKKDGKWGYIDESGKIIIPLEYDMKDDGGYCFRNGLVPVCKEGKYGIINRSGKTVVAFNYDEILQGINGKYIAKKNGVWGILKVDEELFNAENTTNPESETSVSEKSIYIVKTAGSPLNLRKEPKTDSSVVAKIPNGSKVESERINDGWAYVTFGSFTGWVSTDYIVLQEQSTVTYGSES